MEQKLIDYIKETKKQGFSDKEIRRALLDADWKKEDIDEGLKVFGRPKVKSKWLIPVIVVVGIVVLGLVVWGGYELFKPIPEPTPGPVTCVDECGDDVCQEIVCLAIGCPCAETPTTCPEDCEEPDETADWEIYQNEKYGFEVKYPEDWQALGKSGVDSWPARGDESDVSFSSKIEKMNPLVITVPVTVDKSFEDAEQVTINNINFYKFHEFGGDSSLVVFYVVKNDLIYRIMFDEDNPNYENFAEYYKIFNQILSTFKFIE